MTEAHTILLLLVSVANLLKIRSHAVVDYVLATSGACATIASDALMNPFDGEYGSRFHIELFLTSNQS